MFTSLSKLPSLMLLLLCVITTNMYAHGQSLIIKAIQHKSAHFQQHLASKQMKIIIPNSDQVKKVLGFFNPNLIDYCFTTAQELAETKPIRRYISWLATAQAHSDLSDNQANNITQLEPNTIDMLYFLFGSHGAHSLLLHLLSSSEELETLFGTNLMQVQNNINHIKAYEVIGKKITTSKEEEEKEEEENEILAERDLVQTTYVTCKLSIPIPFWTKNLPTFWHNQFISTLARGNILSTLFGWKNKSP